MFKRFPCCMDDESRMRQQTHEAIERLLRKQKREARRELKLLLLGTGESGKSTFIKQMRIIHGDGYTIDDQKNFIKYIYQNVLTSIQNLIKAMKQVIFPMDLVYWDTQGSIETNHVMIQLQIDYEHSQYQEEGNRLLAVDVASVHDFHTFEPNYIPIKNLWRDGGIQRAYERRREYQLSDSTYYYMSDLERISKNNYIPTQQDILRVRNVVEIN